MIEKMSGMILSKNLVMKKMVKMMKGVWMVMNKTAAGNCISPQVYKLLEKLSLISTKS
jgi:hypothetical protein